MLADFVLIDRDFTRIPPETIREARVMLTVVGGRPVFERDELRSMTVRKEVPPP
jgi:predicted amidohydrolase YtcJ